MATSFKYKYGLRLKVLLAFGNKCCKCGFDNQYALQLDHITPVGKKNRPDTYTVYKDALVNPDKYQLLCANCNWIKRHENKEWFRNTQSTRDTSTPTPTKPTVLERIRFSPEWEKFFDELIAKHLPLKTVPDVDTPLE